MRTYSNAAAHPRPSPAALDAASWAASVTHGAELRLRLGFANARYVIGYRASSEVQPIPDEQPTLDLGMAGEDQPRNRTRGIRPVSDRWSPPLSGLLRRTGGLDAVALKLMVSVFWLARATPAYEVAESAGTWAQLLDLVAPDTSGARRVRGAISTMEGFRLVETTSRPPRPTILRLRREDGTGRDYAAPRPSTAGTSDYFFRIPPSLWSGGWLAGLSGPALAALFIVLSRRDFEPPYSPVWITQRQIREEHGLTYRTWWEGLRELEMFDLIDRYTRTRKADTAYQSKTTLQVRDDRLAAGLAPSEWEKVQRHRVQDDL